MSKTKELNKRYGVCRERIVTSVLEAVSVRAAPFQRSAFWTSDLEPSMPRWVGGGGGLERKRWTEG